MIKINLEKELVRQNRSVVTARELLMIEEADRLAAVQSDYDVLKRAGMTKAAEQGEDIRKTNAKLLAETKHFPADRVFHISQIEKLCNRYVLKFLPAGMYKGTVDPSLAGKITQAEAAYGIKILAEANLVKGIVDRETDGMMFGEPVWRRMFDLDRALTRQLLGSDIKRANAFIIAPVESFELQSRPVDPLFFYKINEQYYLLIHKWGNDLSLTRLITKTRTGISWIVATLIMLLGLLMPSTYTTDGATGSIISGFIRFHIILPAFIGWFAFSLCKKPKVPKYNDPYMR